MVPSTVIVLEALPRLPNGKVDRSALPEPGAVVVGERAAPRTATEALLLQIWRRVLKREDLGVTDNFFELGGDSILSLQIVAQARQAGLTLTPKHMFEHPTIARLADVAHVEVSTPERPREIPGEIPLTPIQAWFFEHHPDAPSHWNQAVLLRVAGGLHVEALEQVLQALVAHHDALRLRFERSETGEWHQRVAAQESGPLLAVVDLSQAEDWEVRLEAEATRLQQGLDVGHGPLLTAGYFRLHADEGRLLLAVHHLAVDGVSWRVLLEGLVQAYAQAAAGDTVALPAASTPWSVWAVRQQAYARRPELRAELAWWQAALTDAETALPVEDTGDRRLGEGQTLAWQADRDLTRRLLQAAPRAYRLRVDARCC
jgi:aryl carrier-like protein